MEVTALNWMFAFLQNAYIETLFPSNNIGLEINYKGKKNVENHKHT